MKIKTLNDIVNARLCLGCGVCSHIAGEDWITMKYVPDIGFRPVIQGNLPSGLNSKLLSICPGYSLDIGRSTYEEKKEKIINLQIGNTNGIWEGWATEPNIRHHASSGGVLTALALYSLEQMGMKGVIQVTMDSIHPYQNKTVISRNKEDLIRACGSRYLPSIPLEAIGQLDKEKGPFCFIGKPCDVAALRNLMIDKPEFQKKIGLILTFFCSGTPSIEATKLLIRKLKIDPEEIISLRFRGDGWPGDFKVTTSNHTDHISYDKAWSFLARQHRQFRCNICPDGLGEFSDISCGDAWYRKNEIGNNGCSLLLSRNEKGKSIIIDAIKMNYLTADIVDPYRVVFSQGPIERKGIVRSRLLGMSIMGMIVPHFKGFGLSRLSHEVKWTIRIRNFLGIIKRYFAKNLGQKEIEFW